MSGGHASTVSLTGVAKSFGARTALVDVSLFAQGGVTALLGPNGAGKTTLLRGLATVQPFDSGIVQIDGMDPRRPAERTEIRRRLGYLPQQPGFNPHSSVYDVVDYLAVLKGIEDDRRRRVEVMRVLDEVALRDRASDRVRDLSGGMRQRLGLAQAFLAQPSLVVLDEPASGLDPQQRLDLRARVSRLGEHSTVILSTHLTDEAAAVSSSLHVLHQGRIVFSGTPTQLRERARGLVWLSDGAPASSAHLSWRTGEGRWRSVGQPPAGAELDEPTVEDAYLLLVGNNGLDPGIAAA